MLDVSHGAGCGCEEGAAEAAVVEVREQVRERYAAAARAAAEAQTPSCGRLRAAVFPRADASGRQVFGGALYESAEAARCTRGGGRGVAWLRGADRGGRPAGGRDGPRPGLRRRRRRADLRPPRRTRRKGDRPGHDRRDARARPQQRREAGVENVEFHKGYIEEIPLPDASVDVVISNCVLNLSGDKPGVIREAARVLRPGGRFAISDVIADEGMDDATRADMQRWTGCIAGALTRRRSSSRR